MAVADKKTTKPKDSPLKQKVYDLSKNQELLNFVYDSKNVNDLKPELIKYVNGVIKTSKLGDKYEVLFLYDGNRNISEYTLNSIYKSLSNNSKKPALMILLSNGGEIEPAYLIGKVLKDFYPRLIIAIPRKAKSAATLLCMAADEIHMGPMSELGPIDPQIGRLPALGLGNALEYIVRLVKRHPEASDMFAKYLSNKLELPVLGYFERVSESAVQYGQRLLEGKKMSEGYDATRVAKTFVYDYKDHSFVIDKEEAKKYFGDSIKTNTPEYHLSNKLYQFLSDLELYLKVFKKKNLSLKGSIADGLIFFDED